MTDMAASERIRCSVVYALADRQAVVTVELEPGASVEEALRRSGLLEQFPDPRAPGFAVGIFHRRVRLDSPLRDGDQIEIYRSLKIDPKEARRLRAARKHTGRAMPAKAVP